VSGATHHDKQAGPLVAAGHEAGARLISYCGRDEFRDAIGHFASGVTIITARYGDEDFGVTANAVSSLSLDPPTMLVCLNRASRTQSAVSRSKAFSVNILNESQGDLAVRFATSETDKFRDVGVSYGVLGNPLLAGALAHLECRVIEELAGGTHAVFLAGVERVERFDGEPLAYFRGRFGRLELDQSVPADADILDPALGRYFYDAVTSFISG
jgi:4-nitrophenol 2-monooxygenase / 4-nitrocatechol 4-monooxygenase, reductase component